ncbi:ABC transporter ATP-binding protein [Neobacillus drentensis]|jgi:energy-coupling factor transport system ATP-binding protein|uniref:ABC transporter ATP-binding protein n=1 Tax=Neobacillus drentensis TaxID=220684 RepID=UPI0030002FF6
MRKPVIEFTNFSFHYRAQSSPTLSGINLTIYEGEKILIIGPSGSGKSTLGHCLNGLVPFFYPGDVSGSLKIFGKETKEESIFKLSSMVGTVFQDPDAQFIGLTAAEDIAFKLENQFVPQEELFDSVNRVAELVDMTEHLDSTPQDLSGGQKQRVTLAGSMIDDVNILLFDEPLANLDPATGKMAIELIDRIHKETGKTTIIIEHRLEDVLHGEIDRIVIINEGCILADLTPNELLSSNLLKDTGIREPLYLTALRYAGCTITPELKPKSLKTLNIEVSKTKLHAWYESVGYAEKKQKNDVLLEVKNIHFGYSKTKEIIKDVSFKINKGELIALIGKNGAGKSTLAKLICGFYHPTAGEILLEGENLKGHSIKERADHIGFVLQNPNQMISQNFVFDEVALGLKFRGVPDKDIEEQVFQALKICGLYEFRNWPISALSFGQKKRVTIASVLVLGPKLIILDEPTAGQDYKHYNEIMEFLWNLNQQGITIIMITHDMHLMLEYTNRAIVISEGQKVKEDEPANILTDEDVIRMANLKETSLYQLAKKADFFDQRDFVKRFIHFDRRTRHR